LQRGTFSLVTAKKMAIAELFFEAAACFF
jgi:hypothetical protein